MVHYVKRETRNRFGQELEINWERTSELEKEEKYVNFNRWCDREGIIRQNIRYPVAFGTKGELIGLAATSEIGFSQAFLYVPSHLMINESRIRADPRIGHIIDKHPSLFADKANSEHLVLVFYLLVEFGKGRDSFWFPYFEVVALPESLSLWDERDLDELHDPILKQESLDEMEDMINEFDEFLLVAQANSDCLNVAAFTFENYVRA